MKIIITGSSGFVGTNLIQHLHNKGLNDLETINLKNSNWISKMDKQIDAIIHLAGKAHDTKECSNSNQYFDINTKLTQELFDVFLKNSCRDFIYFSSVKAVADQAEQVVTEATVTNPQTAYGQSKLLAEQYILSKLLPKGKRVFIIRPTMIHGPGNKGNLNLLYKLVSKGIPWPLGAFENKRSFCSIYNVCFVIEQILERDDIPSGVYNLADDYPISTNRLVELIAISKNKKAKIYKISQKKINILAKVGDLICMPLNSERLEKLTENFVVSNEKIVNAIGKPLPVSSEDGLIKTFNSFK
jgi:nucleoside-diphosphate-sugar epimerase